MFVCCLCACILRNQKKVLDLLEFRNSDGWELSCGCWKSHPGPLDEQLSALIPWSRLPALLLFLNFFPSLCFMFICVCEGARSPGTCHRWHLPYGYWELNPGQHVIFVYNSYHIFTFCGFKTAIIPRLIHRFICFMNPLRFYFLHQNLPEKSS